MKRLTLILLLIGIGFYANAQKIKYKDLYVLLRAKNYKDGASFLTKYLSENPEHPNANYQMGLMLEFKLNELDLVEKSDLVRARADSAILYFDKAYALITPKEVKKHDDDYYELFKRRNLRTGKFEVILSDVQLDIENRKNVLEKKKVDIVSINSTFDTSKEYYEKARLKYQFLRDNYVDELSLALAANDSAIQSIKNMVLEYDLALNNFKQYTELKKTFEKASIETLITINPINNFSEEALSTPDFYSKNVNVANFSDWGSNQLKNIDKNTEFIKNIILYDESLTALQNRILQDSVDLNDEAFKKNTDPHLKEITSVDPESPIYNLFHYKIGQLNLTSALMTWFKNYKDTLDVGLQLNFAQNLKKELDGVEQLQNSLVTYNDTIINIRYRKFIEARYQTKELFIKYISEQEEIVSNQKNIIDGLVLNLTAKDGWGFYKEDSISLALDTDPSLTYQTLYIDSLDSRKLRVAGLKKNKNTYDIFFTIVPSSRMVDTVYLKNTLVGVEVNAQSMVVQSVNANAEHCVFLIGDVAAQPKKMNLVYFSNQTGISWYKTIALEPEIQPELLYAQGQIEIHQDETTKKFKLEDGTKQ